MLNFILCLFFGLPTVTLIWFVISLIRYLLAPSSSALRQIRKQSLFTSAIVTSILFLIVFTLLILFTMGIANM